MIKRKRCDDEQEQENEMKFELIHSSRVSGVSNVSKSCQASFNIELILLHKMFLTKGGKVTTTIVQNSKILKNLKCKLILNAEKFENLTGFKFQVYFH